MDDIDVPQYFLCPISLQIMKDPVTTASGISYDRESIEHWLSARGKDATTKETTCPVTKQPLLVDSEYLTPNHTLRRLIQAWCVANANNGIDPIPTPKSPLNKSHIFKLIRNLNVPELHLKVLKTMEEIAEESDKNRNCMVKAGAMKAMVLMILRCFREGKTSGLEEGLKILHLIWIPTMEDKELVTDNFELIESILWVLRLDMGDDKNVAVKTHALLVLKLIIEVVSSSLLEQLKCNFFHEMVKVLRERNKIPQQATKAALHVLIEACPWGRNRMKILEAGAVFELIELELELKKPQKHVTELILGLLAHLCVCADGRAQLLKHAGGIPMVAKRILRVSPATDDRALHIFTLVSKFSATNEVLMEMLRVGAVSKLCMVLQSNSAKYLKGKAKEVLRLHSNVWNNSPCIDVYLLTKDPR
ncbi:E3 ubiquitin-protein like [Actinidia chinensis var. chinensis]|uniref:U-box domain-containing protein n=1 Tax=Actinidia chinensis var. chinensis TaxID=1590841 RepID=A0A2R6P721_ACTCC|nr:E3 ubiquitin-protein like [Actinidia chinensis var. chinensis]